MADHDFSRTNSEKLDRLLTLVEGTEDAPGLIGRLAVVERVLFGRDNAGGLVSQHQVLWRIHTWILAGLSAGFGALMTLVVEKLSKYL